MTRAYFDTSAIVKLVCHEAESLALVQRLEEPLEATTSELSEVEVPRALRRLGFSADDARRALDGFYVIGLHTTILRRAATLQPATIRSLDAIHLATALEVGADVSVVTYDDRLAEAARAQGLTIVQPGR